ncbi:MAG: hypothetical protein WDM71_00480 [Ferruginibacter sp.]
MTLFFLQTSAMLSAMVCFNALFSEVMPEVIAFLLGTNASSD